MRFPQLDKAVPPEFSASRETKGLAMKTMTILALALLMAGCGQPAPTETVESLAANPARLAELRKQCAAERAKLGDELAEASRRRFMGDGKVPYTPPRESPKL